MKYIYSTSQMSKLSLTLHTFSVTGSVAGLFLTQVLLRSQKVDFVSFYFLSFFILFSIYFLSFLFLELWGQG